MSARKMWLSTWYHVAVTYEILGFVEFFINGIPDLKHHTDFPTRTNSFNLRIGAAANGSAQLWEVRAYNAMCIPFSSSQYIVFIEIIIDIIFFCFRAISTTLLFGTRRCPKG